MKPAAVLIVEDNPITRKLFRVTLAGAGYQPIEAEDGRAALDVMTRQTPDLVLQDLQLPDIDGLDLTRKLRASSGGASVPIIAVSGFLSKMEQAQSAQVGFTDFLFKPVEPSRLLERVQMYLNPSTLGGKPGKGELVLVVDDDPIELKLLQISLETLGFRVVTAANGEDALRLAMRQRPAVVVMDVLMPGIDGFNLCQKIRKDPRLNGLPVILISAAYLDEADRSLATSAGASAFLVRSPDSQELSKVMAACLSGALPAPTPETAYIPVDQYLQRIVQQLGRQVQLNRTLTQRAAHLEGEISIVAGLAKMFGPKPTVRKVLEETLARCLSAAGLSMGAMYLAEPNEHCSLQAHYGYRKEEEASLAACFGFCDFFRQETAGGEPLVVPSARVPADRAAEILTKWHAHSITVSPLAFGKDTLGLLVVGSSDREIGSDLVQFTHICANHAAQVIGLARAIDAREKAQEQFFQAQKMEAIGRLAGGVAHDFNNLLTAITGYADLIADRLPKNDPVRGDVDELRKAAQRAASLTRQLLAFGRKQVAAPAVVDVNAVVGDMDKMLRRIIGEDVDIVTSLDPNLGHAKVDSGQIEQIVLNLAVNARDAMPKGGKLTIETANVDLSEGFVQRHETVRPGPYVMLAVSDTGCGMDEQVRSHLFEPFFTTKELGKGTGLGLSTVYGIVKQNQGYVWVYSEPERGSTFKIYLPRMAPPAESIAGTGAARKPQRGSETVLVVEDEDAVRKLTCRILQSHGYTVIEARNGAQAMDVCERHSGAIQLLVTDLVMPGIGGDELARNLLSRHPSLKVLFVSGYANEAVARQGVLAPGAAFLQKPFAPDDLAHKVREVLDDIRPAK
ncbi:MAG: response regulator [Planctomycetes bacterium]|nr:response regulator [Planctomycetota bacterium]